ncbi:MAG: hypothetical protein ACOCWJ_02670 [Verrucomicrobiota bacterium]
MQKLLMLLIAALLVGFSVSAKAGAALGGWGHFLQGWPKVYLDNPGGEAFDVQLNLYVKNVPGWNADEMIVRLTDPKGKVLVEGAQPVKDHKIKLSVEPGAKGVYVLEPKMTEKGRTRHRGPDFWLETTLDKAVVWTGKPEGHAIEDRWLVTQCSVPRRWWFWVPSDIKTFTVKTQRAHAYMSQREDPAITVFSPRGQRMAAMVGQIPKAQQTGKPKRSDKHWNREALIEVEPGAAGRFWAVEVALGDAHHRSNINFTIDGVPPYLARSPESWFNPETGKPPAISLYDASPFVRGASTAEDRSPWTNLQHWSPCPAIGDPDGNIMRGDMTLAFWNPEGRTVRFQLADYLPRIGVNRAEKEARGHLVVTDRNGENLHETDVIVPHYHGRAPQPEPVEALGEGVRFMHISGPERWWAFTYPAIPTVIVGENIDNGWHRFTPQVGNARNYYFYVPAETESFQVRVKTEHEQDRLRLEINAPDRTVELIYSHSETITVNVPPGLDGRVWHLRPDVGRGTRMITAGGPENRYLGIYANLDLKGVPPYLAPTWEQWFNPENPQPPPRRGMDR